MTRRETIVSCVNRICNDIRNKHKTAEDMCIRAAEWADNTMIEKACRWLEENVTYIHPRKGTKECVVNIPMFKQAMLEL